MKTLIISLKIFLIFTLLTGIIYPLFVTGFVQLVFPSKANGSLIIKNDKKDSKKAIGKMLDRKRQINEAKNRMVNNSTRGKTKKLAGIAK